MTVSTRLVACLAPVGSKIVRTSKLATTLLAGALAVLSFPAIAQSGGTDFVQCLDRLQAQAPSKGVPSAAFAALRPLMVWDETVLPLLDKQPEFSTPIWDYLAALVDEERVRDGKAAMQQHATVLSRIARQYAIDPFMAAAVWGVESNFGRILGGRHLLSSLASLSCAGRRQSFFQGELMASVKIVHQGHIAPEKLVGSWAGAFGQTQFMPSTFLSTAVDLDGDGRRDVVDNVGDALASTANFLKKAGLKFDFRPVLMLDWPAAFANRHSLDGRPWVYVVSTARL
jgi:lytic murein transglycosylase